MDLKFEEENPLLRTQKERRKLKGKIPLGLKDCGKVVNYTQDKTTFLTDSRLLLLTILEEITFTAPPIFFLYTTSNHKKSVELEGFFRHKCR